MRSSTVLLATAAAVLALVSGVILSGFTAAASARQRAEGAVTEFPVTKDAEPGTIAAGPDGNLWFTEPGTNAIGRITPGGALTEFPVPTAQAGPAVIAAGTDGNLWFTEEAADKIGRITPAGSINEFPVPTPGASPAGISPARDGNMWFTERSAKKLGVITPSGSISEIPITDYASLITTGPTGDIWFSESDVNKIGTLAAAGSVVETTVPTANSLPAWLAPGPDGNVWFTETDGNAIGRLTSPVSEFALPTAKAFPYGITTGPDGNLWFTEAAVGKIGRITPVGAITEYPLTGGVPIGIATGPDGGLWFTELNDKIGRIDPGAGTPSSGNLLRNPGFDAGVPGTSSGSVAPPLGWVSTGTFTSIAYGSPRGFPDKTIRDQIGGGTSFAAGGPGSSASFALQLVDVSASAPAIDQGRVKATLAASIGGFANDSDEGTMTATFLDRSGGLLGSSTLGPVAPADRGGATNLLKLTRSVAVPSGTRSIRVVLSAIRKQGAYDDAYFDNVSLALTTSAAPPPPPPPPPPGAGAPVISALSVTPASFTVKHGATFTFRLSEAATVTFAFARNLPGHASGKRCVAARTKPKPRPCTRRVPEGSMSFGAKAGAHSVRFNGHVGRTTLAPGSYRVTATARDAAKRRTRTAAVATFRIT